MYINTHIIVSLLMLMASAFPSFSYEPRNHEVLALIEIRISLTDPHGALNNWDEDSVDPCSWAMITCSPDNLVTGFGAPSQGLSGTLSGKIANLTNLKQVLLQNNNISGDIPPELGSIPNLQTLDLSNNRFSGHVPETFGMMKGLQYLRLNNNSLSGPIPLSLSKDPQLAFLDLSFNNLSGPIPNFPARTFNLVGNPLICKEQKSEGCSISTIPMPLSLSFETSSSGKPKSRKLAMALGITLTVVSLTVLAIVWLFWRRNSREKQSILNVTDLQEDGLISLGNLRIFTFRELQVSTDHFSSKNILGTGGFGNVYKGKLGNGNMVAVKRLKDLSGTAGEAQFRTELEMISLAVHRNLLRLIGYCATTSERLLVYTYMPNGSVASRLREKPTKLDWNMRKRIAVGAARGLLYLHEQCDPKIIHRDVKAANILLDEFFEAVVGDFGLAKLLDHADSHVTTAVRGTVGHIAPEYLSTGQSSEKTDVFGFGILLLELITGMRALEFGKTINQKGAILEWVRKAIEEKKIERLIDSELGSNYDRIEVGEMLQVSLLCTQYLPAHRPKMSEIVHMLEGDGLAEKWASTHNHSNPSFNLKGENGKVMVKNTSIKHETNEYEESSTIGLMDGDHDAHYAMELSGPR